MAIEFPQPQIPPEEGFGPMQGEPQEDDGSMMVDIEEEFAEVEEQPDGSAIVRMEEFKGPPMTKTFTRISPTRCPSTNLKVLQCGTCS